MSDFVRIADWRDSWDAQVDGGVVQFDYIEDSTDWRDQQKRTIYQFHGTAADYIRALVLEGEWDVDPGDHGFTKMRRFNFATLQYLIESGVTTQAQFEGLAKGAPLEWALAFGS